jgi:hypothetical protein
MRYNNNSKKIVEVQEDVNAAIEDVYVGHIYSKFYRGGGLKMQVNDAQKG